MTGAESEDSLVLVKYAMSDDMRAMDAGCGARFIRE